MILKSLAFVLIGFVVVVDAQTPVPMPRAEGRAFSTFFDDSGGYLGVQTEEVTKDNFSRYGLSEVRGVAIEKVAEDSPAEKAGLKDGDVIVRLNNEEVTSIRKLSRLLSEVSPDHQVKLMVVRGGSEREIVATLGKRSVPQFEEGGFRMIAPRGELRPFPPSADMPSMPPMRSIPMTPGTPGVPFAFRMGTSGRRIGISVTTLTKQLSEHYGVAGGVLINEVRIDSAAAKAGLKAGDVIIEVEGKELKSEGELIRAITEKKEGDLGLTIIRDRNRQTIRVTPEEGKDGFNSFHMFPVPLNTESPTYFNGPISVPGFSPSLLPSFSFPGFCL